MNSKRTKQVNSVKRDEKLRILRKARAEEQRKKQEEEYKKAYLNWLERYIESMHIEHETPESLMLKFKEEAHGFSEVIRRN